mmetsp:Transcript_5432/g.13404  ORF Transcript_5432/g.13404 Transcript_5432/m.13404 type:complete len:314 (-) Transcript_5432:705-1646(-)
MNIDLSNVLFIPKPKPLPFSSRARKAIPTQAVIISCCNETQTSADVQNVDSFRLPDPAGRTGGAFTSALLEVVYKDHKNSGKHMRSIDVWHQTRDILKSRGFSHVFECWSSRSHTLRGPFDMIPYNEVGACTGNVGRRFAVLIGINYTCHEQGQLSGCHNDVQNIREYIMDVCNVKAENITVLMDDGKSTSPTRANIMEALDNLCEKCYPGDAAFVYFAGHGSRLEDEPGEDDSEIHSALVPVDFDQAEHIIGYELFERLVCRMRDSTSLSCLFDPCHGGFVVHLPYHCVADGEQTEAVEVKDFNLEVCQRPW